MTRLVVLLATVLALLAPAGALAAQPHASFNAIEQQVMCDTCNVPLNIAESPRADQERREIRGLIAKGLTEQQVLDTLKARYGPNILALPDRKGFNLAAYAVPIAAVAIVLIAVLLVLLRWRRPPPGGSGGDGAGSGPAIDDADARRLEEDLARSGV
jgi:cytochrome c-type biogenesis protein CcmH